MVFLAKRRRYINNIDVRNRLFMKPLGFLQYPYLVSKDAISATFRPPLYCNGDNLIHKEANTGLPKGYSFRISVLMNKENATKFYKNYLILQDMIKAQKNIDIMNHFATVYRLCEPNTGLSQNIYAFKQCQQLIAANKKANAEEQTLDISNLILEDAGNSVLHQFNKLFFPNSRFFANIHKFWIAAYQILFGFKYLLDFELVNFNINPLTILYDYDKNNLKISSYIYQMSLPNVLHRCNQNIFEYEGIENKPGWWSYPWEFEYLNRKKFDELIETFDKHDFFEKAILKCYEEQKLIFLTFIYRTTYFYGSVVADELKKFYIPEYKNFLIQLRTKSKEMTPDNLYNEFLEKSVKSIDLYGFGIILLYYYNIIYMYYGRNEDNIINIKNIMPSMYRIQEQQLIKTFIYKIITPNVFERYTVAEAIIQMQFIITRLNLNTTLETLLSDEGKKGLHEYKFTHIFPIEAGKMPAINAIDKKVVENEIFFKALHINKGAQNAMLQNKTQNIQPNILIQMHNTEIDNLTDTLSNMSIIKDYMYDKLNDEKKRNLKLTNGEEWDEALRHAIGNLAMQKKEEGGVSGLLDKNLIPFGFNTFNKWNDFAKKEYKTTIETIIDKFNTKMKELVNKNAHNKNQTNDIAAAEGIKIADRLIKIHNSINDIAKKRYNSGNAAIYQINNKFTLSEALGSGEYVSVTGSCTSKPDRCITKDNFKQFKYYYASMKTLLRHFLNQESDPAHIDMGDIQTDDLLKYTPINLDAVIEAINKSITDKQNIVFYFKPQVVQTGPKPNKDNYKKDFTYKWKNNPQEDVSNIIINKNLGEVLALINSGDLIATPKPKNNQLTTPEKAEKAAKEAKEARRKKEEERKKNAVLNNGAAAGGSRQIRNLTKKTYSTKSYFLKNKKTHKKKLLN